MTPRPCGSSWHTNNFDTFLLRSVTTFSFFRFICEQSSIPPGVFLAHGADNLARLNLHSYRYLKAHPSQHNVSIPWSSRSRPDASMYVAHLTMGEHFAHAESRQPPRANSPSNKPHECAAVFRGRDRHSEPIQDG